MRNKILSKLARIEEHIKEGKPPMAEYRDGSKECDQCDFYYLCHGAVKRKLAGQDPIVEYPVPGVLDTSEDDDD
jgi:radical SAM protein with 4Fe4S-binding SPASM domain